MKIGKALKDQREINKLSQLKLSKKTGISQQNISRWEKNLNMPNLDDLCTLAKFYGISLDELTGFDNE